jgi:hypothetical protein
MESGICPPFAARRRRFQKTCDLHPVDRPEPCYGPGFQPPTAMFQVTRKDNRLDIEFAGKLDAEAMEAALDEFTTKSVGIERGTMLYRIGDFRLPTTGAIALEFSRMPQLLGLMKRFRRCAVLADQSWIRKVSEWEGRLFPGLEIKGFPADQEAAATAWLGEDS